MFEVLFFIIVLLFIAILFYKQANEEIEILQIDSERMEEIPSLYGDRSPIVIKNFPVPALGSYDDFQKRPKVLQMKMGNTSHTLHTLLGSNELKDFQFHPKTMSHLAKESGLDIWFGLHCYKGLLPSKFTEWLYSYSTGLWPSHRGLTKTRAVQTLFVPTQGVAKVCILLPKMIPYLPVEWKGKQFNTLTAEDTPLLSQIQYVEIKLRKGNALLLPAHILVDISSESADVHNTLWMFQAEIHHPISLLAKS